jgi:hypothetical protein
MPLCGSADPGATMYRDVQVSREAWMPRATDREAPLPQVDFYR